MSKQQQSNRSAQATAAGFDRTQAGGVDGAGSDQGNAATVEQMSQANGGVIDSPTINRVRNFFDADADVVKDGKAEDQGADGLALNQTVHLAWWVDPDSDEGEDLLAHEFAHIKQKEGGGPPTDDDAGTGGTGGTGGTPNPSVPTTPDGRPDIEQEANNAAVAYASGKRARLSPDAPSTPRARPGGSPPTPSQTPAKKDPFSIIEAFVTAVAPLDAAIQGQLAAIRAPMQLARAIRAQMRALSAQNGDTHSTRKKIASLNNEVRDPDAAVTKVVAPTNTAIRSVLATLRADLISLPAKGTDRTARLIRLEHSTHVFGAFLSKCSQAQLPIDRGHINEFARLKADLQAQLPRTSTPAPSRRLQIDRNLGPSEVSGQTKKLVTPNANNDAKPATPGAITDGMWKYNHMFGKFNDTFRLGIHALPSRGKTTADRRVRIPGKLSLSSAVGGQVLTGEVEWLSASSDQFDLKKIKALNGGPDRLEINLSGEGSAADLVLTDELLPVHNGRYHKIRTTKGGNTQFDFRIVSDNKTSSKATQVFAGASGNQSTTGSDAYATSQHQGDDDLQALNKNDAAGDKGFHTHVGRVEGQLHGLRNKAAQLGLVGKHTIGALNKLFSAMLLKIADAKASGASMNSDASLAALAKGLAGALKADFGASYDARLTSDQTLKALHDSLQAFVNMCDKGTDKGPAGRYRQWEGTLSRFDQWLTARMASTQSTQLGGLKNQFADARVQQSQLQNLAAKRPTCIAAVLYIQQPDGKKVIRVPRHLYFYKNGSNWEVQDLTNPRAVKLFTWPAKDGDKTPPKNIMEDAKLHSSYPAGALQYSIPGGPSGRIQTASKMLWSTWFAQAGIATMVAGLGLSLGFGAIGLPMLAVSMAAGAGSAIADTMERSERGSLTAMRTAVNVLDVIGAMAGIGWLKVMGTAGKALGMTARTWAKLNIVADGTRMLMIAPEIADEMKRVNRLGLPDSEKARIMATVMQTAVLTGGLLLLSVGAGAKDLKNLHLHASPKDNLLITESSDAPRWGSSPNVRDAPSTTPAPTTGNKAPSGTPSTTGTRPKTPGLPTGSGRKASSGDQLMVDTPIKSAADLGGMASQAAEFGAPFKAIFGDRWTAMSVAERVSTFETALNGKLKALGLPTAIPVRGGRVPPGSGYFDGTKWRIIVDENLFKSANLTLTQQLQLVGTLTHEATHVWDFFLMAMYRVAKARKNKVSTDLGAIARDLGLKPSIVKQARDNATEMMKPGTANWTRAEGLDGSFNATAYTQNMADYKKVTEEANILARRLKRKESAIREQEKKIADYKGSPDPKMQTRLTKLQGDATDLKAQLEIKDTASRAHWSKYRGTPIEVRARATQRLAEVALLKGKKVDLDAKLAKVDDEYYDLLCTPSTPQTKLRAKLDEQKALREQLKKVTDELTVRENGPATTSSTSAGTSSTKTGLPKLGSVRGTKSLIPPPPTTPTPGLMKEIRGGPKAPTPTAEDTRRATELVDLANRNPPDMPALAAKVKEYGIGAPRFISEKLAFLRSKGANDKLIELVKCDGLIRKLKLDDAASGLEIPSDAVSHILNAERKSGNLSGGHLQSNFEAFLAANQDFYALPLRQWTGPNGLICREYQMYRWKGGSAPPPGTPTPYVAPTSRYGTQVLPDDNWKKLSNVPKTTVDDAEKLLKAIKTSYGEYTCTTDGMSRLASAAEGESVVWAEAGIRGRFTNRTTEANRLVTAFPEGQ